MPGAYLVIGESSSSKKVDEVMSAISTGKEREDHRRQLQPQLRIRSPSVRLSE